MLLSRYGSGLMWSHLRYQFIWVVIVCVCVCVRACVRIYMHACVWVGPCACVCMHVCIHTLLFLCTYSNLWSESGQENIHNQQTLLLIHVHNSYSLSFFCNSIIINNIWFLRGYLQRACWHHDTNVVHCTTESCGLVSLMWEVDHWCYTCYVGGQILLCW